MCRVLCWAFPQILFYPVLSFSISDMTAIMYTLLFESRLWISTSVSSIAQGLCFSKNRTKCIFVKISAINSSAFYEAVLLLPIHVTQAVTNPWKMSYSGSSYSQYCMHWTSPDSLSPSNHISPVSWASEILSVKCW